ncbi:MAG: DUF3788 domain-containing protein [Clostridiales bacterium]
MEWKELYSKSCRPDLTAIAAYIESPLWNRLCEHLESAYGVSPAIEHSICSGAPGWNLKYKKGGRALCTLYPAQGFFACLVSVGSKEAMEAELLLPSCTDYLQELYRNTRVYNGGRWLMIAVTSAEILEDVKLLIDLRVKKK